MSNPYGSSLTPLGLQLVSHALFHKTCLFKWICRKNNNLDLPRQYFAQVNKPIRNLKRYSNGNVFVFVKIRYERHAAFIIIYTMICIYRLSSLWRIIPSTNVKLAERWWCSFAVRLTVTEKWTSCVFQSRGFSNLKNTLIGSKSCMSSCFHEFN